MTEELGQIIKILYGSILPITGIIIDDLYDHKLLVRTTHPFQLALYHEMRVKLSSHYVVRIPEGIIIRYKLIRR